MAQKKSTRKYKVMLKYLNRLRLISLNMYGIFLRAKDADKKDFLLLNNSN